VSGPLPGVRAAYDASATAWAQGPSPAYEVMADVLVAAAMTDMAGARVLDLGAGTGAASRAARRAGAGWVVGVDVAPEMLRAGSGWSCALVADAADLPFAAGRFDLVVAACCLGHLPDPGAALAVANIHRHVHRPTVCCPLAVLTCVGKADNNSLSFGNEPRMGAHRADDPICHHRTSRRLDLKRHGRVPHIWAINGRYRRAIVSLCRPDCKRPLSHAAQDSGPRWAGEVPSCIESSHPMKQCP